MTTEKVCAECGASLAGQNHAVRDGERYCLDCCPPMLECLAEDHSDADPQTVEEYEARKATMIDVAALMEDGDAR